eukprot:GFUD01010016.1.p1 GENE.GFUD01010016.1~~GFUD01010016.1.p1  ORF type:complete len:399 (+),score=149.78 GFUD01010016.1:126-1322(+)
MCPGMEIGTAGTCLVGVKGREKEEYNVRQSQSKLQVFIFYPSDWEEDSLSLLSSFSSFHDQFLSSHCCLYGCSTDSVGAHLNWIQTEFGSSLAFPLLSDTAGQLADRYSLFDKEERINMRGVVITDSKGKELEVINTSLESDELAKYALNIVRQSSNTSVPVEVATAARPRHRETDSKDERNGEHQEVRSATGFRSLDHVWSQVTGQGEEATVIESKRPKPSKVWGPTIGQNKDQAESVNGGPQRPKSGQIWTKPASQQVEQPQDVRKPTGKPAKVWGAPPAPSCPACARPVYPTDRVFAADRRHFHKSCIDCQAKGCQNKLTARGLHSVGGLNLCTRCYNDRGDKKVSLPVSKVETGEETRQREAREIQEKKIKEEAMMELRTSIGGGARPSQVTSQ